jgi:hypothetical protein|tara:strand:- start:329 stop:913 length:585 start_codon:yes stop_codon:yes gene_type:complete
MQSLFNFIVKPKNKRYDNKKYIDGQELILNSELADHRYVSRTGIVTSIPKSESTEIQVGDEVIVHHNVFRRWHDNRGKEKNSRSYYEEDKYFVNSDQIFLYKRNNKWSAPEGYCFLKPIESNDVIEKEIPFRGIVKYLNQELDDIKVGDLVGFMPGGKYEFIIEGERLYRILTKFITIKYERQGTEKEYNPSWL